MNESRLGYILQGGYILGGVDPYFLVKGNTIAYVSMCWEYQTSTIFLDINILHLENLSRPSQKKVLKLFPEAIVAIDDVQWH